MTPKIFIHHVSTLHRNKYDARPSMSLRKLQEAAIVIFSDGRYFRCVKNRWGYADSDEKIPLTLLVPYLMQYEEHFTKEDLFAALAYETTS